MTDSSTWHRLTDINPEAMTASCSQCGPTKVKRKGSLKSFTCMTPIRQAKARAKKRAGGTVSRSQFLALLEKQGHQCAICGTEMAPAGVRGAHMDHCHSTGRPRGVLCPACNHGLGNFQDDPALLLRAVAYLEQHQG